MRYSTLVKISSIKRKRLDCLCASVQRLKACILCSDVTFPLTKKETSKECLMCWECLLTKQQKTLPEYSSHLLLPTFSILQRDCLAVVQVVEAARMAKEASNLNKLTETSTFQFQRKHRKRI